ncbi:MAG: hypothetical protein Q9195_008723 [Heterodermia aff. obscurata]
MATAVDGTKPAAIAAPVRTTQQVKRLGLLGQVDVMAIVGVVNTTEYWVGYLGLGIEPTNFTDANQPTFLTSLVENRSLIPSHSYGYTAGAYYRLKSVPASLTLGGFDSNRFEPHNVSFDLDPGRNPVVALNEISVTASPLASSNVSLEWPSKSIELLGTADGGLYTIDASTPYLWLPKHVCLQFEKAFGLTYDDQLELYTFSSNVTQPEDLVGWNMTFTFILADLPGSSRVVSLDLPYAAFDLQLTYPFPGLNATQSSGPTNYFPLRRAANTTQYTIGRVFLQETYLTVDYERNNFSISQAVFDANAINDQRLIDITRPKNSTFAGPKVSSVIELSKAAVAGIAVGATVLVVIFAIIAAVCLRRLKHSNPKDRQTQARKFEGKSPSVWHKFCRRLCAIPEKSSCPEIDGCNRQPNEASTESEIKELAGTTCVELPGSTVETSPCEQTKQKLTIKIVNARDYDPSTRVELHDQCSPHSRPNERLHAKGHAYSPSHVGTQITETTGISSRSQGITPNSSQLSSPIIISPLTPGFAPAGFPSGRLSFACNHERQSGGSDGDALSDHIHEGAESSSDGEHNAQYQGDGSQSHKFSWEEHG